MNTSWRVGYWKLCSVSFFAMGGAIIASSSDCVNAQITPDSTLGAESSVVTPINNNGLPSEQIDGGATRGANLFHSFDEFSIPTGGEAFFNNAADIQNIITRVTGGSISNIDGLLRANGTANLFLLNPNGISFGSNTSLNIGGSFVATTANSINFADNFQYSAPGSQTPPLLTISTPIGLQLGQNPGAIRVQGEGSDISVQVPAVSPLIRGNSLSGLQVKSGNTLALIGGAVNIEGGTLTTEQGRIELGSVRDGQVNLSFIPQGLALSYQNAQHFQDIQLSQQALVDASEGSSIQVQGNHVSLTDGSLLFNRNQGTQGGGDIRVNAAQSLNLSGLSSDSRFVSALLSQTMGVGNGADIAVSTKQVVGQGGGTINARSYSSGRTGNITVNASDFVNFPDSIPAPGSLPINPIFTSGIVTSSFNSGDGGAVNVATRRFSILGGATVASATFGKGYGGSVTVNATEAIEIAGQSSLFSPSSVSSSTFNAGDAGAVTVNTARLIVRDGGNVGSPTVGFGNAGDLTINATDSIELSGTVPNSPTPTSLVSSAPILSEEVQQALQAPARPSGNSGNLTINTPRLDVRDGAAVQVSNDGTGSAGTLKINTPSLRLDRGGTINAATASGEGGNIDLNVRDALLLRRASQITASAQGIGNGGNITINVPSGFIVAIPNENSDISANAFEGRGGNVRISASGVFGTQFRDRLTPERSEITATGGSPELSGTVEINTPDVDPTQGLLNLPTELVDASNSFATGCVGGGENEFIITGRGGLPPNPYEPLDSSEVWRDVQLPRELAENSNGVSRTSTSPTMTPGRIVEATGWIVSENGKVELVANVPTAISQERCELQKKEEGRRKREEG